MPSKSPTQKRLMAAAAHNPAFAKKVGVPQKVAMEFFNADQAGGKRKAKTMTKGMKGMDGSKGMSPRKAMGSGLHEADTGTGGFGVKSFAEAQGHAGTHPDETSGTGRAGHMADSERAIGGSVHHTKGHHPAQAAPNHGPHHPGGYQDHHSKR